MIATFINISSTKFSLNGLFYKKSFIALKVAGDYVRVVSVYDTRLELLAITRFDSVKVDGVIHPNITALINSLTDVLFSKSSSGGGLESGGDFTGTLNVGTGSTVRYNNYEGSSVLNLSLSPTKVPGSYATVKVRGDKTGSFPSGAVISGDAKSTLATKWNEFSIAYLADDDIRGVNRVYSISGASTGDTTAPSVPTGLTSTAKTATTIDLSWTASTGTPDGYLLYKDGVYVKEVAGTTGQITGLTASTAYSFTVSSIDAAGNESAQSAALSVTTNAAQPDLSETIVWEQFIKTASSGNGQLSGDGTEDSGYDNGAYATKALNGDGEVICSPLVSTTSAVGLGITKTYGGVLASNFNMDICALLGDAGGSLVARVYESAVLKFTSSVISAGDVIGFVVSGTSVSLTINGISVYTSAKVFTLPLTPIGLISGGLANSEILSSEFTDNTNLITSPL